MKKFLSLSICALCTFTANAQLGNITPDWSNKVSAVEKAGDAYRQAPVAVTADGTVYATGKFNQLVITDKFLLDPVAQSSFLAKYAADGTEVWAVALAGTATITSIATDEDENIYIAGTLADKVVFNTTSGDSQTLEGLQAEDGSYTSDESASFIAKYDANGVLKATQTFKTSTHPDIAGYVANEYMYMDGNNKFYINHIEVANGKISTSAQFIGTTEINGYKLISSLNDVWGFLINDVQHCVLFAMNAEDLSGMDVIAELRPTEAVQFSDFQATAIDLTFTIGNDNYYIGALGYGELTLKTLHGDTGFNFETSYDDDYEPITEFGHIIAKITDSESVVKTYSAKGADVKNNEYISMKFDNNTLYLGGICYGTFAYDNSQTSTSTCDLYAAALNPDNLEVKWATVDGVDEGEINKFREMFTSMTVSEGNVYLYGYAESVGTHAIQNSLSYICNNGNMTNNGSALVTGSATNGKYTALATLDDTQYVFSSYTTAGDGLQEATAQTTISRNGNTFFFDHPCDVVVYDMQGQAVAKAYNVSKMDVNTLANGCYIVKIISAETTSTCKFMKK